MADITPAARTVAKRRREITWLGDTADVWLPWKVRGIVADNISIQVAGGTLTVQGSLDGTNYFALKDWNGDNISLTDGQLSENIGRTLYIKPVPVGTGVTVTLIISNS